MSYRISLSAIMIMLLCVGYAAADSPATDSKMTIKSDCPAWQIREYKVDAAIKGKVSINGTKETFSLDNSSTLNIRLRFGRREDDGITPVEISVLKGIVRTGDQQITVSPKSYPKLTVLMDRNCKMSDIVGVAGTRYAEGLPGLNYGNIAILLFPYAGGEARAVGDTWTYSVLAPSYGNPFDFSNTLKSVSVDARTTDLEQQIAWSSDAKEDSMKQKIKVTALATIDLTDGKVLKSHAECEVLLDPCDVEGLIGDSGTGRQETAPQRANITVDVALVK